METHFKYLKILLKYSTRVDVLSYFPHWGVSSHFIGFIYIISPDSCWVILNIYIFHSKNKRRFFKYIYQKYLTLTNINN